MSPLDDLPLFANDNDLGEAILGKKRASEWKALAPLYERQGLPKIDALMAGRYVPAVKAFFDRAYGLASLVQSAPDGIEDEDAWNREDQRHRA
jgi:hypothetical protein